MNLRDRALREHADEAVRIRTTNRDINAEVFGVDITVPEGTRVEFVKSHGWAIQDIDLIERLTGNTHDPQYRYVWVNPDCVGEHKV